MIPEARTVTPTPSSTMEVLKQKCLAALYYGRPPKVLRCYYAVLELARAKSTAQTLNETDEKYLRQIQTAVQKVYFPCNSRKCPDTLPAPFRDIYLELQTLLRNRARLHSPWHLAYDTWENRLDLSPWQTDLLFRTAVTLQLTSGCSNFCRRCNEWALPRVRGHFSREAVSKLLIDLLERGNVDLALYGGSDPLDWEDGETTLMDLLSEYAPSSGFSLLTKVPRGKEIRLKGLIDRGIDLAVSLTNRNRQRIETIEKKLGQTLTKQHATPDLLIPACLDEDFDTVKPSITDSYGSEISPDGACIIIPTFTSALYPFGHKKIPVTRSTPWFPVKRLGRPALLQDYFKPLQVIGESGHPCFLDHLLDVQIENILLDNGDDDLTPPGMRSVKEYFDIFEEQARLKRKAMTLSVMRRLKRELPAETSYPRLSQADKEAYRNKISAHLDFTRKDAVRRARLSAASFFLAAADSYLKTCPVNARIIQYLTRREYDRIPKLRRPSLEQCLCDPHQDAWKVFRHQLLYLIHAPGVATVREFIRSRPAAYDPDRDLFCRCGERAA